MENDQTNPEPTTVTKIVTDIISHPKFNQAEMTYDITLLKIESDLDLSGPALGSICVPEQSSDLDALAGKTCTASGWGQLYDRNYFKFKFYLLQSIFDNLEKKVEAYSSNAVVVAFEQCFYLFPNYGKLTVDDNAHN